MKKHLLFVCTGNSARSQMAEVFFRDLAGDDWEVFSAGSHPEAIDQRTLSILTSAGLPVDGLRSKSIEQFKEQSFDYVISLCSDAAKECASLDLIGRRMAWEFEDPKSRSGFMPFEATFKELKRRIELFLLATRQPLQLSPLNFYKSISDETRLKSMLLLVSEHELCVCELMVALNESQPKISRHLAQLKSCGLVSDRRVGTWIFYDLNIELPSWAYTVLQETLKSNASFISEELERIRQMRDRPERAIKCCA